MSDGGRTPPASGRPAPHPNGRGRPRPPGPEEKGGATATGGRDDQPDMRTVIRTPRFWITLLILLALNWFLVPLFFPETQDRVTVPYTFFKQQVASGNVSKITSRGEDIQGEFKQPVADPNAPAQPTPTAEQPARTYTKFATIKPAFEDTELLPLLERNNVVITAEPLEQPRSALLTFLLSFGPAILLIAGFIWINRLMARRAGGLFSLG